MRGLVVLWLIVGCYQPAVPRNVPCGPNDACPSGQVCVAGFCDGTGGPPDASTTDASGSPDASPDGPVNACAGGDGQCLVSCLDTDPDCATTCGDGVCVGNAGELCGNCEADCKTTMVVCGNGACEAGEAPDCYADCGPTPWTWLVEEQQMIDLINAARTGGTTCPGGVPVTAPALTKQPLLVPTAHEWVWELSHHDFFVSGSSACNGRTVADRQLPQDFDAYIVNRGQESVASAVASWLASASACPLLMSTARTTIATGHAIDVKKSYVVVLK